MQINKQQTPFHFIGTGLIIILCSISLFSCSKINRDDLPVPPAAVQASEAPAVAAARSIQSEQTWLLDDLVFVPCANNGLGEYVELHGYVHFTNQVTVNNNHYILVTHTNPSEVSGTGLTTGDHYVASGGGEQVYSGSLNNGQAIAIGSTRFKYMGSGPGNNLTIVYKAHVMVTANGEVSNMLLESVRSCN